ncbi:MAG: MFS transporter [Thauera aminoaromatica]|uniref:MFS transporter n=2 Tax=Thauera aminoaromatica TaxID=164330 RepID=A0A5C7T7K9_THASP|nr:MAG: MFS transporter [Thauera aminoaromatica]
MLMSSLGTSIANVALPTLAQALDASFQAVQWVVLAYLLAITSTIVGVGRLGDLMGRRRLLLAGITVFTLASALCSAAPDLGWLIAARGLQGVGAATMMALTLALVGEVVPKERTGRAMGLLGTLSAVGTALGPTLGGMLIAVGGWEAIFLIQLPLGVAALILAQHCPPADPRSAGGPSQPFDKTGMVLLALTLAAYALAMTLGRGRVGFANGVLLLAAVGGGGLFAWHEARAKAPLVSLAMFRQIALSGGFAMSALVTAVVMASLVVGPFYLASAFGLDAMRVGLVMSSGPLVAALSGLPAGRLVDRLGAQGMILAGLGAMALGAFTLPALSARFGLPGSVGALAVITAGYALFQAANNTAVMTCSRADQRGLVSGLVNLSRNLGLITGAAFMGAVFAFGAATPDITALTPQAAASGLTVAFAVAGGFVLAALLIAVLSHLATRRTQPLRAE